MRTIITTAGRPDEQSERLAAFACEALNAVYEPRKKRSVKKISEQLHANVLVAGKHRYEYYPYGADSPFFYHPNSAAFRLKRVARGEYEPLLAACNLERGDTFLDCTVGIGSDALLAAYAVGDSGRIVGVEADPNVAFIVKNGMQTYDTSELPLTAVMRNIEIVHANAIDYLQTLQDNAFDVVYMDPMFEQVIEEATNFETLRAAGQHIVLNEQWVQQALRVAKKRVVLKAHFESPYFEQFGFTRDVRLTAKFHYGYIEK